MTIRLDTATRREDRLKPRKCGFGFDIAKAKQLAAELSDTEAPKKSADKR
jgi:hypothetical protein